MDRITQVPLDQYLKDLIYAGFKQHSIAKMGEDGIEPPVAFVIRRSGSPVAAVVVQLFWGALHIKYAWVEESLRHQGLGKRLMEHALEFGRELGCPFAFVETMSFQALNFYKKLGFRLDLTREGFSGAAAFHYLSMSL